VPRRGGHRAGDDGARGRHHPSHLRCQRRLPVRAVQGVMPHVIRAFATTPRGSDTPWCATPAPWKCSKCRFTARWRRGSSGPTHHLDAPARRAEGSGHLRRCAQRRARPYRGCVPGRSGRWSRAGSYRRSLSGHASPRKVTTAVTFFATRRHARPTGGQRAGIGVSVRLAEHERCRSSSHGRT
jgi:hypothetical protein